MASRQPRVTRLEGQVSVEAWRLACSYYQYLYPREAHSDLCY